MSENNGNAHGVPMDFTREIIAPTPGTIRGFDDIPDLMTMEIPMLEWLVDGMISRGSMTLWAGADGTAKTFLVQSMAVAVATGGMFLSRRCRQAAVLYLDYENPAYAIRDRLEVLAGGPIPNLKLWGTWLEQQPPQIGNSLLLEIAREARPLIIVDPFRYAHAAQENDASEMMAVMQQLRYCAARGAAVVILHHVAKTEGSNGRGSTAIRGAVDLAYIQSMDAESGLISLKCDKNRFGDAHYTITVKPDFDDGSFTVTDSPQFTRRNQELDAIRQIITQKPGLSQNQIYYESGMKRQRLFKLLKEHTDKLWQVEDQGKAKAKLYFPLVPANGNHPGNQGTSSDGSGGSLVPPLYKGNQGNHPSNPVDAGSQDGDLVCERCGTQGEWTTPVGLAKHEATCKGRVQ